MLKLTAIALLSLTAACGNSKSGKVRDMVAERAALAGFKDRACACTDRACADKVAEDLKTWMSTDRGDMPTQTKEERDKDLATMTEFIGCLDKARGTTR
ncbi:MAG TPA: hypothetical protein VFQ53_28390 [Kofleriaceae bacterium]|nr:hypothetical protein [Kofleriaceae bacterium]